MIILAGGGKAEVPLRQRIGRGLRFKKVGPNVAFVVDFSDINNDHLRGHALQRRAIIEGTKGFGENILAPGKDFDFEALGFKRVA
jgi:superfamily II DNA or RNA helicase